jgi:hypothetical protein
MAMDRAWHGAAIVLGLVLMPVTGGFSLVLVILGVVLLLEKKRN